MGLRAELQKRIEKKQDEINNLQFQIMEMTAYMQALQDTLKLVPKDDSGASEVSLRHGSNLAKAQTALKDHGQAMHVTDLLKAIGLPESKKNKLALGGSIAAYVRKNQIFTRPAPNTFGLREFDGAQIELVTKDEELAK